MKRAVIGIGTLIILSAAGLAGETDRFEAIKSGMAAAECNRIEFLSIIESEVFHSTDTTLGSATIAADGRYLVLIGADTYLFDLDKLYSYSGVQNQVVIEPLSAAQSIGEELAGITRLDEFYETRILTAGYEYELLQLKDKETALPATMRLFLHPEREVIDRFEYHDENDDFNKIVVLSQEILDSCVAKLFVPDFPDSADVVRLN